MDRFDEMYELVKRLYQYMYQLCANYDDYEFTPTDKECVMMKNFLRTLDAKYQLISISHGFLVRYFLFQFNYWHKLKTRFEGRVMLGWVIGPKALNRWFERDDRGKADYLTNVYFTNKKGVSYNNILALFQEKSSNFNKIIELNEIEEREKKRFYNTDRGLLNCMETTFLYNGKSILCLQCIHKSDCKKILITNYPQLAKKRKVV
jgi:hypothetical protein